MVTLQGSLPTLLLSAPAGQKKGREKAEAYGRALMEKLSFSGREERLGQWLTDLPW